MLERLKAGCNDCFYLSPKVGSRGPVDSPFVIVGESPGIDEVIEGAPFVGPSGVVINKTLEKMGLETLTAKGIEPYFTNAIHCLPRQKDAQNLSAACVRCRPRLFDELLKYPRKVILSLGGPALQSLTGNFDLKITKERGKLWKSDLAEIGIVSAVHPAFLLRGGGNYTQFERDVKYAIDLMRDGFNAQKLPNGTIYEVLNTREEVDKFIALQKELPVGSTNTNDIETTGFNYQTDRILYIGIQYAANKSVVIPGEFITDELFSHEHIVYNWHNGKFDCRFLRYNGNPSAKVDDDTMLMSYTLNERRGIHDLDQAASDWLGSVNHKHMVDYIYKTTIIDPVTGKKRKGNLGDLDPKLVQKYVALDINDTHHLKPILKPQIEQSKDLTKFYNDHLIPGSEYLLRLEMNGMLVSKEWVLKNHYRLLAECEKYEEEINEIARTVCNTEINPRSWQQVKYLLYTHLKLAPYTWSTDDDTLKKLPPHPAVKALQNYRKAQKSHGTYVKPLMFGEERHLINMDSKGNLKPKSQWSKKESVVYPDGRTHSNYLLHGTPTSRLACRDLNVQNIPRDPKLRGQFMAREGYGILECDYSQAELRSLAALSKCKALLEIFLTGKDLHNELTTYLFGAGWTREDKMKAKTVNFGIPYGREAPSMAEAFDVSIDEAQSWIDGWAKRFPGAWEFIQTCRMAPIRGQTITTCFGNKKRPGVVAREKLKDLQNESANFPHQSIASNLTIRAGIELIDVLEVEYDTYIINTVHDCIVMEVPLNLPHILKVASIVRAKMEEIPTRFAALRIVPFKSSAEFGHHWGNLVDIAQIENQSTHYLYSIPDYIAAH